MIKRSAVQTEFYVVDEFADVNELRNLKARELDVIFRQVTADAAREALAKGVPVAGLDEAGNVVECLPDGNTRVAAEAQTPSPQKVTSKSEHR